MSAFKAKVPYLKVEAIDVYLMRTDFDFILTTSALERAFDRLIKFYEAFQKRLSES